MSTLFLRTRRDDPADAEVPSHRLLVRAGYVRRTAPGIYSWLPLGLKVLDRVTAVVRDEMDRIGAQEVRLPALLPREHFETTGRWTEYGEQLFRLQDRKGADYLLGPTHEELFTTLVKGELCSHKDLPVILYQVQTKYRDEARPRAGLLRGREFIMKDSYSFDLDDGGLQVSYDLHRGAYRRIFDRLGLDVRIVHAVSGAMGGSASEELLAPSASGEDTFVSCGGCDHAANAEAAEAGDREGAPCPRCGDPLTVGRGIEVGHLFQLGRKYADAFGLDVSGPDGEPIRVTMGSYGMGVSRAVAAIAEQSHDDKGLVWPRAIAPADVHVVALGRAEPLDAAERLAADLARRGLRVLLDDRGASAGVAFRDAELLGVPTILVIGKDLSDGLVELRDRRSGDRRTVAVEEAADATVADVRGT